MVGISSIPEWLEALLGEKFFNACLVHESEKKNIFCLDCCISICPHCLSSHRSHRLLRIRRYVYQDVIQVGDVKRLIDCSFVQSYKTNRTKVVFLNQRPQRPQSRPLRDLGSICSTCDRSLQDPYLFCSLSCKINHLVRIEGGLNKNKFQFFQPKEDAVRSYNCDFDDGQMTPLILESGNSLHTSSGSTTRAGNCKCTLAWTVKKKRSSVSATSRAQQQDRPTCSLPSGISKRLKNRRKSSNPHRSPLY